MDTRTKIVSLEAAEEAVRQRRSGGARLKVVTGFFDPLLAAHARRLGEIAAGEGGILMVAVGDPPQPLLPARARAELVAALASVDYVVLAASPEGLIRQLQPEAVFREEARDEERTRDLIRHVHLRHHAV